MKWTLRRNGQVEATIALRLYVPKDMVLWLKEHAGLSQTAAVTWIIDHVGDLLDDWRVLAVDSDGEPFTMHVDEAEDDNYTDYAGPRIALQRSRRSS